MQNNKTRSKINSPNQFGFATQIKSWTENICGREELFLEFVLEIPNRRGGNLKKLVYANGSLVKLYLENLKPKMCVSLTGKHEVCPYQTERPQYLTDLGIFKIKSLSIVLKDNGAPKFMQDYYNAFKQKNAPKTKRKEYMQKPSKNKKEDIPDWIEFIPRQNSDKNS